MIKFNKYLLVLSFANEKIKDFGETLLLLVLSWLVEQPANSSFKRLRHSQTYVDAH